MERRALEGPIKALNALSCDDPTRLHQFVDNLADVLKRTKEPPAVYDKCIGEIVSTSKTAGVEIMGESKIEEARIQITSPRSGEILSDPKPLGPGFSYLVRGRLRSLPEGHQIWLIRVDERVGHFWPQGFYPVQFDDQIGEWHGRLSSGSGISPLRIVAVVAPPTSQDLFRYFQRRGEETNTFVPLGRIPPECGNSHSIQVRLP